jgi:hypothetical protein
MISQCVERKAPWEPRSFTEDNAFHLEASRVGILSQRVEDNAFHHIAFHHVKFAWAFWNCDLDL